MTRMVDRCATGTRLGLLAACVIGSALGLGGCVGQGEYDKVVETNRAVIDKNITLQRERDESRSALELQRNSLAKAEAALAELRGQNGSLAEALRKAGYDLDELRNAMAQLEIGPLDEATDKALAELAAQFPDLITYDSARGMLRFASDLTFASGSADLNDSARSSLSALARILTSPSASGYDVHIVGHTDSQRIGGGTAVKHPTNVHLSAHRSISVRSALASMSVPGDRMMVAGWGEFRPAVPNTPGTGNTPANRRVEIFLTKSRSDAGGVTPSGNTGGSEPVRATPSRETPPTRPIDVTK
ncbi:MAG: OmpA family protein [Phycisphaerae bacterium]|nr:OmpA family protein [Phycisphaerae bacterium]